MTVSWPLKKGKQCEIIILSKFSISREEGKLNQGNKAFYTRQTQQPVLSPHTSDSPPVLRWFNRKSSAASA